MNKVRYIQNQNEACTVNQDPRNNSIEVEETSLEEQMGFMLSAPKGIRLVRQAYGRTFSILTKMQGTSGTHHNGYPLWSRFSLYNLWFRAKY